MSQFFDHAVAMTREHSRAAVAAYRAGRPVDALPKVFLLWVNDSVIGVYQSRERARHELQTILGTEGFAKEAWKERGRDRWVAHLSDDGLSPLTVKIDERAVGI